MLRKYIRYICIFFLMAFVIGCDGSSSSATDDTVPPGGSQVSLCVWGSTNWDNCNWQ